MQYLLRQAYQIMTSESVNSGQTLPRLCFKSRKRSKNRYTRSTNAHMQWIFAFVLRQRDKNNSVRSEGQCIVKEIAPELLSQLPNSSRGTKNTQMTPTGCQLRRPTGLLFLVFKVFMLHLFILFVHP